MGRFLKTHKPGATDVRRLLAAIEEEDLRPRQKRRAEVLLLYAEGMSDMARVFRTEVSWQ
jgi:hypothetical protein